MADGGTAADAVAGDDPIAAVNDDGPVAAVARLVWRYLSAFGPASKQDFAQFVLLRQTEVGPAFEASVDALVALPGPHRSGAIAGALGRTVENTGPLRSGLIRKGMIWSPAYGETAFTVPLFDEFMRRAIPVWLRSGSL